MQSDPLGRVAAGQVSPFVTSARTVNAALDRLRNIGTGETPIPTLDGYPVGGVVPRATVLVRNDTGSTLPEFAILKLGSPLVSATDQPYEVNRIPAFSGSQASAADDAFCVCLQPSKSGEIVRAAIIGAVVCQVSYSDAGHEYAAPGASVFALSSAATGPAKIVWSAGTTGTQRAVVILQGDMGGGGGSGDVVGPSSATDNAIARYDTTTGKLIQNSAVTISDAGRIESGSGNSKLELDNTRLFIGQQGSGSQYGYAALSSGKVSDGTLGALIFATFPGGGLDSSATIAHAGDGITCAIGDTARARFKIVSNNASTNDPFFSVDRNGSVFDGVDATLPDGSVVKGGIITTAGSGTFLTTASAAATYLTQSNAASTYLTASNAATTYQPLDGDLTAISALSGTDTIYYRSGASTWSAVTVGTGLSFSSGTLSATGGGGTVTSVGMTVPSFLSVSGSPVTGSGSFTVTLANQSANLVFAGPSSGGAAAPTFRSLTAADLPAGVGSVPPGTVIAFGGSSAPTGYLACDGSAVSRTTYADLFAAIGTTWGAGNGSTTFNVPNLNRRTLVGSGGTGTATLGNAVGDTGGTETHTLAASEIPAHAHGGVVVGVVGASGFASGINLNLSTGSSASTGGGGSHNNLQPSAVVNFVIKT